MLELRGLPPFRLRPSAPAVDRLPACPRSTRAMAAIEGAVPRLSAATCGAATTRVRPRSAYSYHSCRHRACPKCHGDQTKAWLDRTAGTLPPACPSRDWWTFTLQAPWRRLARRPPPGGARRPPRLLLSGSPCSRSRSHLARRHPRRARLPAHLVQDAVLAPACPPAADRRWPHGWWPLGQARKGAFLFPHEALAKGVSWQGRKAFREAKLAHLVAPRCGRSPGSWTSTPPALDVACSPISPATSTGWRWPTAPGGGHRGDGDVPLPATRAPARPGCARCRGWS